MFKVVPDQLRVSDGWVRCGQCNEVFDANAHLQSTPSQPLSTPIPPQPRQEPVEQPVQPAPIRIAVPRVEPQPVVVAPAKEEKVVAVVEAPVQLFLEVNPQALLGDHQEVAPPAATLREQRDNLGRGDVPVRKPKVEAAPNASPAVEEAAQTALEQPQHSFMRQRRASGVWSRPWMRTGLAVGCVVLVGVLVLQVAVHERDRIVATEPSAKRFLLPLCEVLNCRIEPLRQIEAIVIDSSSFSKVRSDAYRLSFVLKNAAQTAVATPAVELTLTDLQDQAIVRRVFTTADFNKQALVMEPGAELSASVPLSVKHGVGQEKVSGYRLVSFYP